METILSYCDSKDNIVTQNFSSQELMVVWSSERIKELAHLPLREQLEKRSIRQVILTSELNAHATITPDEHTKDTFCIRMLLRYQKEWSLCVGHELAHTYFFKRASSGLYRLNIPPNTKRTYGWWKLEDEVCEVFGEMWVKERTNHVEVYELLAPIASQGGVINIYYASSKGPTEAPS